MTTRVFGNAGRAAGLEDVDRLARAAPSEPSAAPGRRAAIRPRTARSASRSAKPLISRRGSQPSFVAYSSQNGAAGRRIEMPGDDLAHPRVERARATRPRRTASSASLDGLGKNPAWVRSIATWRTAAIVTARRRSARGIMATVQSDRRSSASHPGAVGDRDHRRDRLRVRHLRAADAAADRAAGAQRAAGACRRTARWSTSGSAIVLRPGGGRRHLRAARRLPHRPASAAGACWCGASCSTRSRRSRPATRRRSTGCSSGAAARSSASASSSSPRWRGWPSSSRIRSSAKRVLGYTQAFGSLGGVMVTGAYYLVVTYGDRLPAVRGGARGVALHADVRRHPGASADPHPAVPARVAGVAAEEGGRHAQAAEHRRAVPAAVPHARRSSRR